jgi:hypothetical protein
LERQNKKFDEICSILQHLVKRMDNDEDEPLSAVRDKGKSIPKRTTRAATSQDAQPETSAAAARRSSVFEKITSVFQRRSSEAEEFDILDTDSLQVARDIIDQEIRQSEAGSLSGHESLHEQVQVGEETEFWLTRLQLELNSTEIDSLSSSQTQFDATHDYLRFLNTAQMLNQLETNGINYQEFLTAYHIVGYDLSTRKT